MGVSKVIFGNQTIIDLTADNITASDLAYGKTAHGADGEPIVGSNTYDADTSDANATAAEILTGKSGYVNGVKISGSMPNRGGVTGTIATKAGAYAIPNGYHDGSGTVEIDSTEQGKIIPENIKSGVEILGVTGNYTGASITAQAKSVPAYTTQQTVLPDSGYDYLSQVTVAAISYVETTNSAGGKTVTIGLVAPT